jgi:hypothetical protein
MVVGCRSAIGVSHSVHSDRDFAHQQTIAQPDTGQAAVEIERLLARWGALHAVRSVLGALALLLFLYLAIFTKST